MRITNKFFTVLSTWAQKTSFTINPLRGWSFFKIYPQPTPLSKKVVWTDKPVEELKRDWIKDRLKEIESNKKSP